MGEWLGQAPELQDFIRSGEQRVEIEVPNVLVIPPVLLKTDLVALIPWHFGPQFEALYGIKTYKLPLAENSDHINLIWLGSYENDPELRWFRDIAISAIQMR